MSMRNIGAFMGGAAAGLRNGVQIGAAVQESDDNHGYYSKLSGLMDDYKAGRGVWASKVPTVPVRGAGKMAAMGSGEDNVMDRTAAPTLGGGDAAAQMQQGIGAMPGASATTAAIAAPAKKLPFMEFLGG